ncbi:MAG TPA: GreA/GreB family elongation factor [Rhizomicrobium sp.]|jgi:transcription elongation GreA/GreB family factor
MSRAFVKETANDAPPPERMVTEGPNLVTPEGAQQIAREVARLEAALKAGPDVLLRETLERDLRYWAVRQASAEIVPKAAGDAIAFGSRVSLRRGGRVQTFRIVGEDEADPAKGLVNIRAPLVASILGAEPGETIETPSGEIEILTVEN